jgi:hypothetical protein
MTAQEKLARYNTILDIISQTKVHFASLGMVPQVIIDQHAILEALVMKQIKDLEIA